MQGLGNKTKVDPNNPPALIEPKDIYKLFDIVQAARDDGRRVLFFCSDPSPFMYYGCHRKIVAEMLRRVGRMKGEEIEVEEWPGGKPTKKPIRIEIPKKAMDRVLRQGGQTIDIGERMPPV